MFDNGTEEEDMIALRKDFKENCHDGTTHDWVWQPIKHGIGYFKRCTKCGVEIYPPEKVTDGTS